MSLGDLTLFKFGNGDSSSESIFSFIFAVSAWKMRGGNHEVPISDVFSILASIERCLSISFASTFTFTKISKTNEKTNIIF